MPKTLQAVCGIDRLRVWQDGGVFKLMGTILAQAKKATALPEAFHLLTPDEQDALYVCLSCC
jgi:hypothetical protein